MIAVTDLYEHADRLNSYRRLAGIAKAIAVKPSSAANAEDQLYEVR